MTALFTNVCWKEHLLSQHIKATSTKSYVSQARLTHEISKCKDFVHFSSSCIGHMSNGNGS